MREVDYNSKAWNEITATQIFHYILNGEVAYASGIATKLDINPQTANNYISGLKERGLISEKERIQGKIIYKADTKHLAERFYEKIIETVKEEKRLHDQEGNEDYSEELNSVLDEAKNQENRIKSISLIDDYLEKLFNKREPGTITLSLGEILKYELSFSLMRYYYNRPEEVEEWFETLILLLIYSRINGWSISTLHEVMEDRK